MHILWGLFVYCDIREDCTKVMYIYALSLLLKLMGIYLIRSFQVAHTTVRCHFLIYSSRITGQWLLLIYVQTDSPVQAQFSRPVWRVPVWRVAICHPYMNMVRQLVNALGHFSSCPNQHAAKHE